MQTQAVTHLLIAGSRGTSSEMLTYAQRVVRRAHQLGWVVLVGDNPRGVDLAVVRECLRLRTKVVVAGVANFPRNGGCKHGDYVNVERDLYRSAGGGLLGFYTVRDRWMVDMCQIALFIWNGDSPCTLAGYEYAVQRDKNAHLVNFDRSPQPYGR